MEYGLLLAGVAALIVAVVFFFGGAVVDLFDDTCDSVGTGSAGRMSCATLRRHSAHRLLRYHERRDAERLLSGRA